MIRLFPVLTGWQKNIRYVYQIQQVSKSSVVDIKPTPCDAVADDKNSEDVIKKQVDVLDSHVNRKDSSKSNLVANVFASLKALDRKPQVKTISQSDISKLVNVQTRIEEAKDIDMLLQIAAYPALDVKSALKIISILGDWTAEKKIKLSDFEGDARFVSMCRLLGQGFKHNRNGVSDLATVLGVTGDDEAAKLITGISLPQMVKVLSTLSTKKRRSTPVLRSLAFNISRHEERLNIKQVSDVLFSIATLNFPDEILLEKVCSDGAESIMENTKSSIAGSIVTSLGILRYRDTILMDQMCQWFIKNVEQCRTQDMLSFVMTLALVNYTPSNNEQLFRVLTPHLKPAEVSSPSSYLDLVWSLVLLRIATPEQISTVLSSEFINKLRKTDRSLAVGTQLKLLNINAAAKYLTKNYKGNMLNLQDLGLVPLSRTKDKQTLVECVMETFANLLSKPTHLKTDIDTQDGFLLDGECLIDSKCNPLPVNSDQPDATRVAITVLDYQDICKGSRYEPHGVTAFCQRVLEARGYYILDVPYTEFNSRAKLLQRVQYLEKKLKQLAKT